MFNFTQCGVVERLSDTVLNAINIVTIIFGQGVLL